MSNPTREEFEARIEALETRMDARVAAAIARLDAADLRAEQHEQRMEARFNELYKQLDERDRRLEARMNERDKHLDERLNERDKRLEERDKRLDLIAQRVDAALARSSHLSTHMWLVATAFILAVAGTVVGTYYAAQSAHIGTTQAVISALQLGQQLQLPLKE
jgi:ribosome-associated translation inhibitor RaiA